MDVNPTQEWTVEENDYGTTINRHDGSEPVSLPIGRPWFKFATEIVSAHNAALAAVAPKLRQNL